jgi:hypothetical protein
VLPASVILCYALVRIVVSALEGRPEIDPDVLLLRDALLLPNTAPFASLLVQALGMPAAVLITAVLFRRRGPGDDDFVRRAATVMVALTASVGLALMSAVSASAAISLVEGGTGAPDAGGLMAGAAGAWLTVQVAGALTAVGVVALGNQTRGALCALAIVVFEPVVASQLHPAGASAFLLNDNVQTIMRQGGLVAAYESGGAVRQAFIDTLPGTLQATAVLLAYALLSWAAAAALSSRRTLPPHSGNAR